MSMSSNQTSVSRKFSDGPNVPSDVKADVDKLIAEGNESVSTNLINKLRNQYSDPNIVDMIVEGLSEKVTLINKRATKFAEAIIKHSGQDTPFHVLLKRALKYKEKLGLSDAEFEFFKKKLHDSLNNNSQSQMQSQGYSYGNTNLSRALGNVDFQNINP